VNFILHADERYATMRDQVRSGAVGRVASTFARRRGTKLGIDKYAPWTDLLLSTAIHDLEMMLAINPSPLVRVHAEGVQRLCAPYGCEDAVVATLKFADGAIASLDTSWTLPATQPEPLDPAFHVVGDQGGIFIDGSSHGMRVISEDGYHHPDMTHWPTLPFGMGGALTNAVRHFVRAVQTGTSPLTTLTEARRAHVVVDALKASIAQERPVNVEDSGPVLLGGVT
jgi:predicted dehydrogenase